MKLIPCITGMLFPLILLFSKSTDPGGKVCDQLPAIKYERKEKQTDPVTMSVCRISEGNLCGSSLYFVIPDEWEENRNHRK